MKIRITTKGLCYNAAGLALLTDGLYRGAFLSTVCGCILLIYTVSALFMLGITVFCWRKEKPVFIIKEQPLTFTVMPENGSRFPPCTAGTVVYATAEYTVTHKETSKGIVKVPSEQKPLTTIYPRELMLTVPLYKTTASRIFEHGMRGRYYCRIQYLHIQDAAGFFSIKRHIPAAAAQLLIIPAVPQRLKPVEHAYVASRSAENTPNTQRTAELYESRQYFYGDDPRKIHWKLYAHTHQLAIKIGAYEPPVMSTVMLYIEEPVVRQINNRTALLFDAFLGRIVTLITQLLNAGIRCTLLTAKHDTAGFYMHTITNTAQSTALLAFPRIFIQNRHMQIKPLSAPPAGGTVPPETILLYCYLPLPKKNTVYNAGIRAEALRTAPFKTYFYAGTGLPSPRRRTGLHSLLFQPLTGMLMQRLSCRITALAAADAAFLRAKGYHADVL